MSPDQPSTPHMGAPVKINSDVEPLGRQSKRDWLFVCSEYGLDLKNPFSGVYMNRTDGVKPAFPR
jgi:hypothetical protein